MEESDLRQRIDRLEEEVHGLEQRWDDEQRRVQRQRQRARWMRLGILVLILIAYLVYLRFVISIPG